VRSTKPIEKCTDVDIVESEVPVFRHPREVARDFDFLNALIGVANVNRFVSLNQKSCLLVGSIRTLLEELKRRDFAARDGEGSYGSLVDLLRPRLGSLDSPIHRAEPARCHIVGGVGDGRFDRSSFTSGACTVIDGAPPYLRFRDLAVGNTVVVLDRWGAASPDAAAAFRQDLASSIRDADMVCGRRTPQGIEMKGFWSRR
jgi:hypothetical protein